MSPYQPTPPPIPARPGAVQRKVLPGPRVPLPCGGNVGVAQAKSRACTSTPTVPAPCGANVRAAVQPKLSQAAPSAARRPPVPVPCGGNVAAVAAQRKAVIQRVVAGAAAHGFLVDDIVDPGPGQVRRSVFLAALRERVTAVAAEVLAAIGQTPQDCPYIAYWFAHYQSKSAHHVEQAIDRYAPEAAAAGSWTAYADLVAQRVKTAFKQNVAMGSLAGVPSDVPLDLEQRARRSKGSVGQLKAARPVVQRCQPRQAAGGAGPAGAGYVPLAGGAAAAAGGGGGALAAAVYVPPPVVVAHAAAAAAPAAADDDDGEMPPQGVAELIAALLLLNRTGNGDAGLILDRQTAVVQCIHGLHRMTNHMFKLQPVVGRTVADILTTASGAGAAALCHKAYSHALLTALKNWQQLSEALRDTIPPLDRIPSY